MPCRRMHGPPVRRSPYASFIYTVSGGSAAALGQVPENTFALCPADGAGFLSVMQHMFCETVVLYTYEDGALHEQTLLYEVPVDDLSGLSQSGISSGSNADIVALLKAEASAS